MNFTFGNAGALEKKCQPIVYYYSLFLHSKIRWQILQRLNHNYKSNCNCDKADFFREGFFLTTLESIGHSVKMYVRCF